MKAYPECFHCGGWSKKELKSDKDGNPTCRFCLKLLQEGKKPTKGPVAGGGPNRFMVE